jgi:hypothetical protein
MHCQAKSKRTKEQCNSHAMKDKTKCRMHGGRLEGIANNNKNAKKENGVYSKFLSDEDLQLEKDSGSLLGKLDHELSIARIQLARALKAQTNDPDSLKDLPKTIDLFLGRINSLEKTRKELLHDDSQDNVLTIIGGLPD